MVSPTSEESLLEPGARLGSFIIKERLLDRTFWETYLAVDSETGKKAEVQCVRRREARGARGAREARGGGACGADEFVPGPEEFLDVLGRLRTIESVAVPKVLSGGIEGDIHWIARAWVRGVSVLSFRTEVEPPTMAEALADGAFFADGLEAAAKVGIVHGNVSPRVCLITAGRPTVLDVGSRALFGLSQEDVLATPLYRAPEQLAGKVIDDRADVYSLGMVLYEILSGAAPFSKEASDSQGSPEELVTAILTRMPDTPDPRRVDPVVTSILEYMYAKDPGDRYPIERACGALCTIVRFLRNDDVHAAAAAAHKRERVRKRENQEAYFEIHAARVVSSGFRARGKEGATNASDALESGAGGEREVRGAEERVDERREPQDAQEAEEPSPDTLPSVALRRRGVAQRWRKAIAAVFGMLVLVLLVCAQLAFERRVESRAESVLSKAARFVGTLKVEPLLEPNEGAGKPPLSPPMTGGAIQGDALPDAVPLTKDEPKAAKRGARRGVAAPARVAPSAEMPPIIYEPDPSDFGNDWD
jgi:hypothetical protein